MRRSLILVATCLFCISALHPQSNASALGTTQDEAAIRAIVSDSAASKKNPHVSPDLDWENAFGVRYSNLEKRDAFYSEVVSPLQKDDTDSTLEVKVKFLTHDVAVADEYWHIVGQLDLNTHKTGPDRWGRTTYIFTRTSGQWTEVLERVADLRYAYYKHYDQLPAAAPVPASTLASWAGKYQFTDNKMERTVTVDSDHLVFSSPKRRRVAIPVSESSFLLFDPNDLAEYSKLNFSKDDAGKVTISLMDEVGDPVGTLIKIP